MNMLPPDIDTTKVNLASQLNIKALVLISFALNDRNRKRIVNLILLKNNSLHIDQIFIELKLERSSIEQNLIILMRANLITKSKDEMYSVNKYYMKKIDDAVGSISGVFDI